MCVWWGCGQCCSSGKLVDFPKIPLATREKRKRVGNQHRSPLLNEAVHAAVSDMSWQTLAHWQLKKIIKRIANLNGFFFIERNRVISVVSFHM